MNQNASTPGPFVWELVGENEAEIRSAAEGWTHKPLLATIHGDSVGADTYKANIDLFCEAPSLLSENEGLKASNKELVEALTRIEKYDATMRINTGNGFLQDDDVREFRAALSRTNSKEA